MYCSHCKADIDVQALEWQVYEQKVFCGHTCVVEYIKAPKPIRINQRRRSGDIKCIESAHTVENS